MAEKNHCVSRSFTSQVLEKNKKREGKKMLLSLASSFVLRSGIRRHREYMARTALESGCGTSHVNCTLMILRIFHHSVQLKKNLVGSLRQISSSTEMLSL